MPYVAKDFGKLVGMDGFSETLLKNHFTLYQGYVTNTNKLSDLLGGMLAEGKTASPEYAELINILGLAMKVGLTTRQLKSMTAAYPTVGSDLGSML